MQSSSVEVEQDLFPLSWLSQYGYCPRRCGLLALEQEWVENEYTASGRVQHQRVHTTRIEREGLNIFLYDLSVYSHELGVSGKCDCIEAHGSSDGVPLPYGEGLYQLYPIEYKHGTVRQEKEYHIQLCAQAMCLESQFGGLISKGAVFYINSHRRSEIELTATLREETTEMARKIQNMLLEERIPVVKYSAKCKKCSMLHVCQPKIKNTARSYCQSLWNLALEEENQ